MGPAPYRVAGIGRLLQSLGLSVTDLGDLSLPAMLPGTECANPAVDQLAWTAPIRDAVGHALDQGGMPVVLGGDHALALGSVAGAADHAARAGLPLFMLWLDAPSDFHTPLSMTSGNLRRVRDADGMLHVSLDVDFLDPALAPAVGTTLPGGATFRETHLVCELIQDTGLMTSLNLVELNPFLDDRGRTAKLMVDLTGSLMGSKVFDRPTRSFT